MNEFKKRKKEEKKGQAYRQLMELYEQAKKEGKEHLFPIHMNPPESVYSTIDISDRLNIPRERFRDWIVKGFVKPSIPATGHGTVAIFTIRDVRALVLFRQLVDLGFKRRKAASIIKELEPNINSTMDMLNDGDGYCLTKAKCTLVMEFRKGEYVLHFEL
jgi:hypothetical protein